MLAVVDVVLVVVVVKVVVAVEVVVVVVVVTVTFNGQEPEMTFNKMVDFEGRLLKLFDLEFNILLFSQFFSLLLLGFTTLNE
jgi:hypothetical protein